MPLREGKSQASSWDKTNKSNQREGLKEKKIAMKERKTTQVLKYTGFMLEI